MEVATLATCPSNPRSVALLILAQTSSTCEIGTKINHLPPISVWAGYSPSCRVADNQYTLVTSEGFRSSVGGIFGFPGPAISRSYSVKGSHHLQSLPPQRHDRKVFRRTLPHVGQDRR